MVLKKSKLKKVKSKVKPVVKEVKPKVKPVVKKKVEVKATYERLTKEEYAKALQHPKWQRKRLKIMERDKWRCRDCGNTEAQLHVHHLAYTKRYPWNEDNANLITYCNSCHAKAHKIIKR